MREQRGLGEKFSGRPMVGIVVVHFGDAANKRKRAWGPNLKRQRLQNVLFRAKHLVIVERRVSHEGEVGNGGTINLLNFGRNKQGS